MQVLSSAQLGATRCHLAASEVRMPTHSRVHWKRSIDNTADGLCHAASHCK